MGERARVVRDWPHDVRKKYILEKDSSPRKIREVAVRNTMASWLRATEVARWRPLNEHLDFHKTHSVNGTDVGGPPGKPGRPRRTRVVLDPQDQRLQAFEAELAGSAP